MQLFTRSGSRGTGLVRTSHPALLGSAVAACVLALAGCGGGQGGSATPTGHVAGQVHVVSNRACEKNPLDGVHSPDRLKVLNPCAAFQGRVAQAPVKNPDGDVSFEVTPDPGYRRMLNAKNRSEGGLHIEIVRRDQPGCTPGRPVHAGDVPGLGTCSGRDVTTPALGAHVRIIGPWVLDRNNRWFEMHPVWSIGPAGCRAPRLIGRTLPQARKAIARQLCSLGSVRHRPSVTRRKGLVVGQHPRAGALLEAHASIDLTIGLGPRK